MYILFILLLCASCSKQELIYEDSRHFKTTEEIRADRLEKKLIGKHDDTNPATYRNARQYPPRGEKNRALNKGDYGP